ncbi:MAG: TonB-dependent receptor plug domain-containing protein [Janthinobacterium lividum]
MVHSITPFAFRVLPLALLAGPALAQKAGTPLPADTLRRQHLDEVVVTATRTEKSLTDVAIPVSVIGAKQIKSMGSLRLGDVLSEQTGLSIVNDHGQGIQMQGLNSEYTLILVDGEPLIGRTAGTLDLTRIAVGNIQRVEVVKGPASALWGSDALAGVVNIITQKPQPGLSGGLRARYGSNHTADLSGTLNAGGERASLTVFANRYSSAGYTLQPESGSPSVPPFASYTGQSRFTYSLSERTKFSLSGRYFVENQESTAPTTNENGITANVTLKSRQTDFNLNPTLTHRFAGDKLFATARLYYSRYHTQEDYTYATDGSYFDATYFTQTFLRPEGQLDYSPRPNQTLTVGGGWQHQTVEATRYDQLQTIQAGYGYAQYDWTPFAKLNLIAGARYDGPSQYAGQLSSKLALRYQLTPWLALRGSVGRGYRAPDFRQLYLNFSNPTVGYSVFGTNQVQAKVAQLAQQGQLAVDPSTGQPIIYQAALDQAGSLNTESSLATNFGFLLEPRLNNSDLGYRLTVNAFRNDLSNLIETTTVALKKNGQSVFSYRNVTRAYTQGVELENSLRLPHGFTVGAGYQYLIAKDKSVVDALEAGTVFRRDATTFQTERVRPSDYGGLFNRSRHSWNAKVFYENQLHGLTASVRGIYRGRYGFADANANTILDADNEYVSGYLLLNVAASKTLGPWLSLQAGIDNLTNYTDPAYISTLAGRLYYASLAIELGTHKRP